MAYKKSVNESELLACVLRAPDPSNVSRRWIKTQLAILPLNRTRIAALNEAVRAAKNKGLLQTIRSHSVAATPQLAAHAFLIGNGSTGALKVTLLTAAVALLGPLSRLPEINTRSLSLPDMNTVGLALQSGILVFVWEFQANGMESDAPVLSPPSSSPSSSTRPRSVSALEESWAYVRPVLDRISVAHIAHAAAETVKGRSDGTFRYFDSRVSWNSLATKFLKKWQPILDTGPDVTSQKGLQSFLDAQETKEISVSPRGTTDAESQSQNFAYSTDDDVPDPVVFATHFFVVWMTLCHVWAWLNARLPRTVLVQRWVAFLSRKARSALLSTKELSARPESGEETKLNAPDQPEALPAADMDSAMALFDRILDSATVLELRNRMALVQDSSGHKRSEKGDTVRLVEVDTECRAELAKCRAEEKPRQ
mmetsp:Transcript_3243/g.4651  ORF Transcript_3243/g.4651 Transcript_3243/m.4651 type:complete len:424 (+) Transcript_3243:135-1406(+)